MPTVNDIVTDDYQMELLRIRDSHRTDSFRVGDITNELVELNENVSINRVHMAVASFVGKSKRTVREYSAVSKFYPPDVRQQYDVLSFDHFRVAMRYGENWETALQWCLDQVTKIDRPATVEMMELQFSDMVAEAPEENRSEVEQILELLEKIRVLVMLVPFPMEVKKRLAILLGAVENDIGSERIKE